MQQLPGEPQTGPVEYKVEILTNSPERLQELATQLKYRLEEGNGEAFYFLGVSDDGRVEGLSEEKLERSLENLKTIADLVGARIVDKRIDRVSEGKYVAEVLIREIKKETPVEVNIAVLGHVNAGKSTLTGALITGGRDNGDGLLRNAIARYLHEIVTGRTSSVTMRLLGFSSTSVPVNWSLKDPLNEADVMKNSLKIVRLIDLGGHERYLRTTLKGLIGYEIDYAMLVVGSDDGLLPMGREHLALATTLRIPMFVVVTKIDKPNARTEEVINEIKRILKLPGINKLGFEVKDERDVVTSIIAMRTERVVPIFRVSNVTGEGINLLLKFINSLPAKKKNVNGEPLGYIDEIYSVPGAGTVVLVSVTRGSFKQGEEAFIGPFQDGSFASIKIKSIQINRVFVESASAGNVATFAIQGVEKEKLRKGMVITKSPKKGTRTFRARIVVLHHPTTIRRGYVATVHLKTIRQAARFVDMDKQYVRTGDITSATLEFLYRPEYLEPGSVFVFREGRTRGIGVVNEVLANR